MPCPLISKFPPFGFFKAWPGHQLPPLFLCITRIRREALYPQIEGKAIFLSHGFLKHKPFHQNHKNSKQTNKRLNSLTESMEYSTGTNGNRRPLLSLCHRADSVLSVLHAFIHLPITKTIWRKNSDYPHFTDEEIEIQRLSPWSTS